MTVDRLQLIQQALDPHRDPVRAVRMAAYMKHRFDFLGIPSPERRMLTRTALRGVPKPDEAELRTLLSDA